MPGPLSSTQSWNSPVGRRNAGNCDAAAFGRELDRIRYEIDDDLLQGTFVGHELAAARIDIRRHALALFAGTGERNGQGLFDDGLGIERDRLDIHFARLDLRDVENVIDEAEEVAA